MGRPGEGLTAIPPIVDRKATKTLGFFAKTLLVLLPHDDDDFPWEPPTVPRSQTRARPARAKLELQSDQGSIGPFLSHLGGLLLGCYSRRRVYLRMMKLVSDGPQQGHILRVSFNFFCGRVSPC